jgi:hypothetical protein
MEMHHIQEKPNSLKKVDGYLLIPVIGGVL